MAAAGAGFLLGACAISKIYELGDRLLILLARSPFSKSATIIVMLPLARRWDGVLNGIGSDVRAGAGNSGSWAK
jgi:hypothetical protein